jgi:tetratricopeptide (TPR) repeat protein/tRNA A-37 threonylcarbamoyl transferase component Bud32
VKKFKSWSKSMIRHSKNIPCLDETRITKMLSGKLTDLELGSCEAHIENCKTCQQLLERLTSENDVWFEERRANPVGIKNRPNTKFVDRMKDLVSPPNNTIQFPGTPHGDAPLGQLGRYNVLAELGSGGMGHVFLAIDSKLGKQFAIKVLNPELALDPKHRERFDREGRAAAKIKNDHVVAVFSANDSSEFNLPYLVMEYVNGESLSELLDRLKSNKTESQFLSVRKSAELIRQAALGLAAAHKEGLVHRDVKPANLMLEESTERVKVADFGLARSFESSSAQMTRFGAILGTPSYMSPEHIINPDQVDQRSDIFSLGSVLYELLTGEKPFVGQEQMVLSQVVHEAVRAPRKLNDCVPRDLETICLKCLRKSPTDRYQTAAELADDLGQFLDGKPILARPISWREERWMWCRRNPLSAALLTTVTILGGALMVLSVTYVIFLRASIKAEESARARAAQRTAQARQAVDEMYTEVAEEWLAEQSKMQIKQREFLLKALSLYQEFALENSDDPVVQRQAAIAQRRVADINYTLGDTAKSELAFRKTIFLQEQLLKDNDKPVDRMELATTQTNMALVLANNSRLSEAKNLYLVAQVAYQKLVDEHPNNLEFRLHLANCLSGLSQAHFALSESKESERCCRQAIKIQEGLVVEVPEKREYQRDLATSFIHLGMALEQRGEPGEALEAIENGIKYQTALVRESPVKVGYRKDLANSLTHKSRLQALNGQLASALETLQSVEERQEKLVTEFPDVPENREELLATTNAKAGLLRDLGQLREAEASYRKALEILSSLKDEFPDVAHHHMNFAGITSNLCGTLERTGRSEEARNLYDIIIKDQERLVDQFPDVLQFQTGLAISCNNFGSLLEKLGQPEEAERVLRRGIQLYAKLRGEAPDAIIYQQNLNGSTSNLCRVLNSMGRREEAEAEFRKTIADQISIVEAQPNAPEYQSELAHSYNNFGSMLGSVGEIAETEVAYRKGLEIRHLLVKRYPDVTEYLRDLAASQNNLGEFFDSTGQLDKAQEPLESAREIRERLVGEHETDTDYAIDLCGSYGNLGRHLRLVGENKRAIEWFQKAIDSTNKLLKINPKSVELKQILRNAYASHSLASNDLGDYDVALAYLDRALELNLNESMKVRLQTRRAMMLVNMGDPVKVELEVEAAAKSPSLSGDFAYDLACALSLASKFLSDQGHTDTGKLEDIERFQARAVSLLEKSASMNFLSQPKVLEHSKKDNDLDPLRDREDFKKLIASVSPSEY